jgi:hypothetical protein
MRGLRPRNAPAFEPYSPFLMKHYKQQNGRRDSAVHCFVSALLSQYILEREVVERI